MVTGLTIPDKALIIVQILICFFLQRSGENTNSANRLMEDATVCI